MSSKFMIVFDNASKEQRDTITHRLDRLIGKGYKYWHWMENVWLVSTVEDVTAKSFSEWLEQTPGIDKLIYIVFQVMGPCPYWGRGNEEGWKWMAINWDKPST